MKQHHYTRALSRIARNSATMLQQETLGSKVDLPALLSVSGSASQVNEFTAMFKQWYLITNPDEPNPRLFLFGGIMNHPPLMVAAQLNQFANTVDQILDVASIFEQAAAVLDTHGWIQGDVGDHRGTCMMGALDLALAHAEVTDQRFHNRALAIWTDVHAVLREQLQTSLLVDWNDDPSRTKADVVNLLRQSAAVVRTVNL